MVDTNEKQAQVGVSVLINKGDRILLEKRAHTHGEGTWGPPSGHIDYGETPEQTAMRETREETTITIDNLKFRVVTNDVFEKEQKHYITIWFDADYVTGEPKASAPEEETEVGWFTWDSLPQPLFLPLQHLLEGKTYPTQTTTDKLGAAIDEKKNETIDKSRL